MHARDVTARPRGKPNTPGRSGSGSGRGVRLTRGEVKGGGGEGGGEEKGGGGEEKGEGG